MPFFLERIAGRIARAIEMDMFGMQFKRLIFPWTFLKKTLGRNRGSCRECRKQGLEIRDRGVDNDLEIGEGGAVVEFDESKRFLVANRSNPSEDGSFLTREGFWMFRVEDLLYFCSHGLYFDATR